MKPLTLRLALHRELGADLTMYQAHCTLVCCVKMFLLDRSRCGVSPKSELRTVPHPVLRMHLHAAGALACPDVDVRHSPCRAGDDNQCCKISEIPSPHKLLCCMRPCYWFDN